MINKIVYLIASPLYNRDYDRFGAEIFIKSGYQVCFYNIAPFINSELYKHASKDDLYLGANELIFDNIDDIISNIKNLQKSFIISLIHFNSNVLHIYKQISKNKIPYALNISNCVPTTIAGVNTDKIKRLGKFSLSKLNNFIYRPKHAKYFGINQPTYLLAGGDRSISHPQALLAGDKSKILWLHTFDYDIYLKNKNVDNNRNIGVFIDAPSPRFTHDAYIKGINSPLTEEKYYPKICKLFDIVENQYDVKIEIAAHPKTKHAEYPEYYGRRKTVYGKTCQLIRDSKFIINRNSTSVNFAILFNKPVIFHTSDEIESDHVMSNQVRSMASWIGKNPINIDNLNNINWINELTVDNVKYLSYKNAFIKKDNSTNKYYWESVRDHIRGI